MFLSGLLQLRSRDGVNKLYILYYWFWKLGDSVSVIFCLLITYYGHKELQENPPVTLIPHLFQQKFVDQTRSFATFAVVMFSLAVITLLSGRSFLTRTAYSVFYWNLIEGSVYFRDGLTIQRFQNFFLVNSIDVMKVIHVDKWGTISNLWIVAKFTCWCHAFHTTMCTISTIHVRVSRILSAIELCIPLSKSAPNTL